MPFAKCYILNYGKSRLIDSSLKTKYYVQKLPDFDRYILVNQTGDGHWSGLCTKEQLEIELNRSFMPYEDTP